MDRRGKREKVAHVRHATEGDLLGMLTWLEEEWRAGDGGFYCERDTIEAGHKRGQLLVLLHPAMPEPAAFCVGGGNSLDILEVHPDMRRQGLGTALAKHWIGQARKAGRCGVWVQCQPESSIPFWKSLGFELLDADHSEYGYHGCAACTFGRRHRIDPSLPKVQLGLSAAKSDREGKVIFSGIVSASCEAEDTYVLQHRLAFFCPNPDSLITVTIDGARVWERKRMYSSVIGLNESQRPFVFLDTFQLVS